MSALYRDALAYARLRQVLLPDQFYALPVEARQWAATVSGLGAIDQIDGVLGSVTKALESGQTFADWRKAALADPALGKLSSAHLDNIFRTNIQSAYNQGRDAQFERNKAQRPYLMWDAVNDGRTRPDHARWDGYIAPVEDQSWQAWHGRNKFRCRCKRIALTQAQAVARGLNTQGAPPNAGADTGVTSSSWRDSLDRAVQSRVAKCAVRTAAPGVVPSWCLPGPIRTALEDVQARIAESPAAALEREIRSGLRGERYEDALQKLRERGALSGPLSEVEAVALHLWSGDNAARPRPDGNFPYQVIGRALRAMGRGETSPEWGRVAAIVAGATQALQQLPEPRVSQLYRGFRVESLPTDIRDAFLRTHTTAGATFQTNSFTSYSSRLDIGRKFAGADGWIIVLRNPRQVRDIGVYSALPSGAEFLAPLQRQYRIIDVDPQAREISVAEVTEESRQPLPRARNFSAPSPDDVVEIAPGHTMLRRYAEDPDYMAWRAEQSRLIAEARRNPAPLAEADELVVNHMLYG